MIIHAQAEIPLPSERLDVALREFAAFVRRHLLAGEGAELSVALLEGGAAGNSLLAQHVPGDTREFGTDWIPRADGLTAGQFRSAVSEQKPKKSRSQLRLPAHSIPNLRALLESLAETLPPSGRGIMLLLQLSGWRLAGDAAGPAADASFSRFQKGKRPVSSSLALRFQAMSLKDPVVAATITAASQRVGLRFGKPMASFGAVATALPSQAAPVMQPDARLQPPSPESQLVVMHTFSEAISRAADQIGARREDLDAVPLLFSRSGGAHKRIHDVMAGKKEKIELPARLKRFMQERFPAYRFDASDPEQLWFRNPVAPALDLLLMFERIHHWGLGKSFSVHFAADFPNTPFGGMHAGFGGTRASLFRMFHQDWEQRVWAYTTSEELSAALAGCAALLGRVLPALEEQCRQLLLPLPDTLPATIEQCGALSAREAYQQVLPSARRWAADAQLEAVGSTNMLSQRAGFASSIHRDGRLQPHGSWSFKFVSRHLDSYCHYTVPHTGRIHWNFYAIPQGGSPKYSAVLELEHWIDSTGVAPRAFDEVARQQGGQRVTHISLSLHDPKRYAGNFVWEAYCIVQGNSPSERRDIRVQLDPVTGELIQAEA